MAANAWDGDPWEVGSDDEEFVSRASGSGVGRASTSRSTLSAINTALKAAPGATPSAASERSPNSATATSRLGALWGSGAAAPAGATSAPRAHAPPARPHPISFGSYKEKRTASQTRHGSETLDQLKRTDSGTSISTKASDGANRRTSWLIVDPDTLTSVPPLDRGASNGRSVSPNERASPAQGSSSTSGKGKAALRGSPSPISPVREPPDLQGAIEGDIDKLLEDPSAALERLSIQWASGEGDKGPLSPISTGLPSIAAGFSNAPPPEALQGDAFPPATPVRENAGPHLLKARVASPGPTVSRSGTPSLESQDRLTVSDANASLGRKQSQRSTRRRTQFLACLSAESVDLTQLRTLAWKGVPSELRPLVWQLLLGYLPTAQAARKAALARKRAEYSAGVQMAFAKGTSGLDQAIWHQISIDVPRTNPGRPLWQREATQRSLERILYVWALRHPACGYVQGINDLATPFFEVFLSAYIDVERVSPQSFDPGLLPETVRTALEADTFWCLSKMLDGIQDNYIFAQPGIQRQVRRLGELVARIDAPLHAHLNEEGVEYMQFAFRWMNCLLMREMAVQSIVRLWDTYLAEGPDAFSDFHLYVCAVFLHKWTAQLQQMDFQGIIMHLQSLPTQDWSDKDAEMLLSEAFMYKTLFGNTAHLNK